MRLVWLLVIAILGAAAGFLFTRFESDPPTIQTRTVEEWISDEYRHEFRIADSGMGLQSVRIWVENGGQVHELEGETYPGGMLWGAETPILRRVEAVVKPGELGLADGQATLHVEARDFSWRGNVKRSISRSWSSAS